MFDLSSILFGSHTVLIETVDKSVFALSSERFVVVDDSERTFGVHVEVRLWHCGADCLFFGIQICCNIGSSSVVDFDGVFNLSLDS